VPADFVAAAESLSPVGAHHDKLLANFFAQTEALAFGKTAAEARVELEQEGLSGPALEALLPHKVFEGNRPTRSCFAGWILPRWASSSRSMNTKFSLRVCSGTSTLSISGESNLASSLLK
jgi:Phosphoglucose isomerase